jgi:hypothetical protein
VVPVTRRHNGEGSIYPNRNGFAAYAWITTLAGRRQRKYVYGKTREVVHTKWVQLTREAARGPVVTKVPTLGQFLQRWLDETVAPNLAPADARHVREPCPPLHRAGPGRCATRPSSGERCSVLA